MSKFKVGDKVKLLYDYSSWNKGDIFLVNKETSSHSWIYSRNDENYVELCYWTDETMFELVKEEKEVFDYAWLIKVNSEAEFECAKQWIEENIGMKFIGPFKYKEHMKGITNAYDDGAISKHILWVSEETTSKVKHKEIKLNFKTIVDSVEYPVVETEVHKKLKELEATAKQIQEQIQELKKEI